jgi:hypothetical protein
MHCRRAADSGDGDVQGQPEVERFKALHRFASLPDAILAARRACGSARVAL